MSDVRATHRRHGRRVAGAAKLPVFLLLLFPLAASAQSLQTYTTPHYAVHTNLPRDEAAVYAAHMNRVFANYQKRFDDFRMRHDGAMPLYLFRQREDYVGFMRDHGINAEGSGGMFFVDRNVQGLATFTAGRSRSQTFAVLQHEGFHQFAYHYIGTDLPIWLNEGIAQYFEDGVLIRGNMTLGLSNADRIERVRAAIRSNTALPIQRVLTITPQEWHATLSASPEQSALLYAQSWSMLYFMLHVDGGRHQQKMTQYLKLVASGRSSEKAFETAFGVSDLTAMENNWRRYALAQEPDTINAAVSRLEFFGSALRFMAERDERFPRSFGDLRDNMQKRLFTLRRTSTGVDVTLSSSDDDLFRFKRPNGSWGRFVLLEPARNDLPPRISAEGLSPEPTLIWSKSDDGQLIADIEFR